MFGVDLPLWAHAIAFVVAALMIGIAGAKATRLADRLADRTGMGEAITGSMCLGLTTALPGLVASVVAAAMDRPAMAIANALGGIAAQTAALAVADLAYPKANLEHAAASLPNIMQAVMLVLLLTVLLLAAAGPDATVGHIHPMSLVLFIVAGLAIWIVRSTRDIPMWHPEQTSQTVEDVPREDARRAPLGKLAGHFVVTALATGIAGAVVANTASTVVEKTGMSEIVVGGLFMAVATSLPELVTSVAAVRQGSLTLAVSDIVGGNFFDVLFVAAADLAYLRGSVYHAPGVGTREFFLIGLTMVLNVILLMGLVYRQRRGPANIGIESALMLLVYVVGFLVLALAM